MKNIILYTWTLFAFLNYTVLMSQILAVDYQETMLMPEELLQAGIPAEQLLLLKSGFSNHVMQYTLRVDGNCFNYKFDTLLRMSPDGEAMSVTPMNFYTNTQKIYKRPARAKEAVYLAIATHLPTDWDIVLDQQRTILGYASYAATSKLDPTITAWFSTDIPVAAGPGPYGGLPGLILEIEGKHKRWVATRVTRSSKATADKSTASDCNIDKASTVDKTTWTRWLAKYRDDFLVRQ